MIFRIVPDVFFQNFDVPIPFAPKSGLEILAKRVKSQESILMFEEKYLPNCRQFKHVQNHGK